MKGDETQQVRGIRKSRYKHLFKGFLMRDIDK